MKCDFIFALLLTRAHRVIHTQREMYLTFIQSHLKCKPNYMIEFDNFIDPLRGGSLLIGVLVVALFRSLWKHFRAVSLCLFLLIFPAYMAYMICQFFLMDFWLLIIISSSILTSLQVHTHTHQALLLWRERHAW